MKAQHVAMQSLDPYAMHPHHTTLSPATSGLYSRSNTHTTTPHLVIPSSTSHSSLAPTRTQSSKASSFQQPLSPVTPPEEIREEKKITEVVLPVRQTRYK